MKCCGGGWGVGVEPDPRKDKQDKQADKPEGFQLTTETKDNLHTAYWRS